MPVNLFISHIAVSQTKRLDQIIVYLRHEDESLPRSHVRIKLHQNSKLLEFDLKIGPFESETKSGRILEEITVNWHFFDLKNNGVFYTDANSYKIVKR